MVEEGSGGGSGDPAVARRSIRWNTGSVLDLRMPIRMRVQVPSHNHRIETIRLTCSRPTLELLRRFPFSFVRGGTPLDFSQRNHRSLYTEVCNPDGTLLRCSGFADCCRLFAPGSIDDATLASSASHASQRRIP
jgi:hypothetical protein